jgi:hypothetical protein
MLDRMILESSPETHHLKIYKQKKIFKKFPNLVNLNYNYYLDLWKYLDHIPERFFSVKVFEDFSNYLENQKRTDPEILAVILKEYEGSFSLAFRSLAEINALQIHDLRIESTSPSDQYALLQFCIENINPNYLKLIEATYANLILPIAAHRRLKNQKKLEGFDVYQRNKELEISDYSYIANCYRHTIRNSIAHGNIKLFDRELIYEDKASKEQRSPRKMIELFDDTVDICNGLALALKMFYIHNSDFIANKGIIKPIQIIFEELQSEIDAPGWKINGCLPSQTIINSRSQLIIFINHNIFDPLKVDYYLLRSAVFAEKFYSGYERYFFSLSSKSLPSWASFNGKELEMRRLNQMSKIEDYKGVWEEKIIFNNYRFMPTLFFRISTLLTVMKAIFPLKLKETMEDRKELLTTVRTTEIHRIRYHSVLNASVVVESNSDKQLDNLIRANCSRIASAAIKVARQRAHFNNASKYLIVGYFRIKIFARDYRIRKLENSGLMPDLLCTLEFNKTKKIKSIDIAGGIPEIIGDYRIVWNKRANIPRINLGNSNSIS